MSEEPNQTEAQTLAAACQADLDRLIPRWLGIADEEEREWQIQRFLDKLNRQPELLEGFYRVLLQGIAAEEILAQPAPHPEETELRRRVWRSLSLMKN